MSKGNKREGRSTMPQPLRLLTLAPSLMQVGCNQRP